MRTVNGTPSGPIGGAFSAVSGWLKSLALQLPAANQPRRRVWMVKDFDPLVTTRTPRWAVWLATRITGFSSIQRAGWGAPLPCYAKNILSVLQEDSAGADDEYAIIVCFRHAATALGYPDAMRQKYGEVFSRVTRLSVPDGAVRLR